MRFDALTEMAPDVHLQEASNVQAALAFAADAEILVTMPPHLLGGGGALLAAAPKLKWIQCLTTGVDGVIEHLSGRNVVLTNARGLHGRQMSEAALTAMLGLARQMPRIMRNQTASRWDRFEATLLAGKTVGIVGMGAIAETLAPMLKALGMRAIGISGSDRTVDYVDETRSRTHLAQAVADLDFLIVLVPLSPDTTNLIDASVLSAMKPGAFLVNLARGGIVDEAALLDTLDSGHLGGAAMDVFAVEPLAPDSRFWTHDRVIVTPHTGGLHTGYGADVVALTRENFRRYLSGDAMLNPVAIPSMKVPHVA